MSQIALAAVSVAALAFVTGAVASARQIHAPRLTPAIATLAATNTGEALQNVVVDGDTVFAAAPSATVPGNPGHGAVFVFTKPSAGWSGPLHEVAVLTPSDGSTSGYGAAMAVSGGALFVSHGGPPGTNEIDVFTEPAGGWAGALHQSATLTASDAVAGDQLGYSLAASGGTLVAGDPSASALYVFQAPAGGWVGNLHQTAKLTTTDPSQVGTAPVDFGASVAISGTTIVGAENPFSPTAPTAAYLFTEPAGGWHDATESAKLVDPNGRLSNGLPSPSPPVIALAGDTVALPTQPASGPAEVAVFVKPPAGWLGSVSPTARLTATTGTAMSSPAAAGQTIVASGADGKGYVFVAPHAGWTGTATENATLSASDGTPLGPLTTDGTTVVADGELSGTEIAALGPAYVFEKPAAGWAGSVPDSARLAPPNPEGGVAYMYLAGPSGWTSAPPSATLAPSGTLVNPVFGGVVASGTTVVAATGQAASSYPGTTSYLPGGPLYLYSEPQSGWTNMTQSATLTASDGTPLTSAAIDGPTVGAVGGGRAYVFTEPASGWEGNQTEAATLAPSDGASLQSIAVSGGEVVAGGTSGAIDVFTEPTSGWSGPQHESAKLYLPDGYMLVAGALATSGSVIVAGGWSPRAGRYGTFVFVEPPGGWLGGVVPSATLVAPHPKATSGVGTSVAIAGSLIFAGTRGAAYIYAEPLIGWTGQVKATTLLNTEPGAAALVLDGRTLVSLGEQQCGGGHYVTPCATSSVFAEPPGGWVARAVLSPAEGTPAPSSALAGVALQDRTVFTVNGTGNAVEVQQFAPPPGTPAVSRQTLTGLASGRPRLRFTVEAGLDNLALSRVTISLPRGLRLGRLRHGISLGVPGWRASRRHGQLVVSFTQPVTVATFTLRRPALIESPSLRHRAALGRRHHRRLRLRATVVIRDSASHSLRIRMALEFPAARSAF